MQRIPIPIRAILGGLLVSGVPTFIWAILAAINLKRTPAFPWSVAAMAVVLWFFWRLVRDKDAVRAADLDPRTWQLALAAGGISVATVWSAFAALRGVLHLPQGGGSLPQLPLWTILPAIVMGSLVAGVAEEAGFRGVMQGLLEKAWGVVPAIVVTSILFTMIHLTHGLAILPMLPFYFVVAVAYSLLARLTGSIRPGIVLHFVGDVMMMATQLLGARGGAAPIATGSVSAPFVVITLILATLSIISFKLLAREAHPAPRATAAVLS